MSNKTLKEKLKEIENLKLEFTTIPKVESGDCPECGEKIYIRDRVESGGEKSRITILHYCDKCGYYKVGDPFYSSDDY